MGEIGTAEEFSQEMSHDPFFTSLNVVEVADETQDQCCFRFRFALEERFVELPSRVRPAPGKFDASVFACIGSIRAVGIALKRAAEVVRDDVFEALMPASGVPMIHGVSTRLMTRPEVTLCGFPFAGSKVFDRRFIDLHVTARELLCRHRINDGSEPVRYQGNTIGHCLAGELDSVALLVDLFLPVERKVIGIFPDHDVGEQSGREHASFEELFR